MSIAERIKTIQRVIHQVEESCNRPSGSVELLAVSKGQSWHAIEQAFDAGVRNIGENYVQEALIKMQALSTLPLCWHFIGVIQSNKTSIIAQNFSWVHGVCRKKIAQLLNDQRPASLPALNVCIQVNIDNSDTKSGIAIEEVMDLAAYITHLPRLHLRGLMAIPTPTQDEHQQYLTYLHLANLLQTIHSQTIHSQLNLSMDTLSMGMSDDLTAAIRAGSTMVRVGRGIFGERQKA